MKRKIDFSKFEIYLIEKEDYEVNIEIDLSDLYKENLDFKLFNKYIDNFLKTLTDVYVFSSDYNTFLNKGMFIRILCQVNQESGKKSDFFNNKIFSEYFLLIQNLIEHVFLIYKIDSEFKETIEKKVLDYTKKEMIYNKNINKLKNKINFIKDMNGEKYDYTFFQKKLKDSIDKFFVPKNVKVELKKYFNLI